MDGISNERRWTETKHTIGRVRFLRVFFQFFDKLSQLNPMGGILLLRDQTQCWAVVVIGLASAANLAIPERVLFDLAAYHTFASVSPALASVMVHCLLPINPQPVLLFLYRPGCFRRNTSLR